MSIEGKGVVVTGVASGGGRIAAQALAERVRVVEGCGRRRSEDTVLESEVKNRRGEFLFVAADPDCPTDCEAVIGAAFERYGRIDVLVNITLRAITREVTLEAIDRRGRRQRRAEIHQGER